MIPHLLLKAHMKSPRKRQKQKRGKQMMANLSSQKSISNLLNHLSKYLIPNFENFCLYTFIPLKILDHTYHMQLEQMRIFWGGCRGVNIDKHPPPPKKNCNWHRLQTFALWQSGFAFITQKSHQNVHKDLLTPKQCVFKRSEPEQLLW